MNFTGSQAHSFMFLSSSKLKIFFLKRTMTKAIWVSDILKEKPISDHLYGWSLLPTAGRCHGDLLDISILSESGLTVFGWHHKWSYNIEISSCRAKGPLVEIQGRQNHCWREVCHSLIWPSFCLVYDSSSQWPHDARWLITACAENKLLTENVENCCSHSGLLADFPTCRCKCCLHLFIRDPLTGPSELCYSFVTWLTIREHMAPKAFTSPSDGPERKNCSSEGSSISESVMYWDIHLYKP